MSTSIMFELSHKIGLICCHKAQQHHATPEIKLIRSAQQTCRCNASTCLNQGKQKIWQHLLIAAAVCRGFVCLCWHQTGILVFKNYQYDNANDQLEQKLDYEAEGVTFANYCRPLLIPFQTFGCCVACHLEKRNRLSVAVQSEMIWNSILLNWLLPV